MDSDSETDCYITFEKVPENDTINLENWIKECKLRHSQRKSRSIVGKSKLRRSQRKTRKSKL